MTFCEEHLPLDKHECIVVAEEKGQKRGRLFSILEVVFFIIVAGVIWWLVNYNH